MTMPVRCIRLPILLLCLCVLGAGEAPGRTLIVDGNHPTAADTNEGTEGAPFKSISAAATRVKPGDTVIVRPGIYRERVAPARGGVEGRPVTFRADPPGKAVVRGSDPWTPAWETLPDGIRRGALVDVGASSGPFLRTVSINGEDTSKMARPAQEPLPLVLGMVIVAGEAWEQVATRALLVARERTWMATADGKAIDMHPPTTLDLSASLVEITTRAQVFAPERRGLGYITVSGFVFEHAANQGPFPMVGMVSVRSGHHWTIEQCTIRLAATVGLDCGSESWDGAKIATSDPADRRLIIGGHHRIEHNRILDNGLSGIAGWNHSGTKIIGNVVSGNNRMQYPGELHGWEEWAGIKLHATDSEIVGNLIRDNHGYGVWIDNGHGNAAIRDNIILRSRGAGVFLELNDSPNRPCRISGNLIVGTRAQPDKSPTKEPFFAGFGVYAHDASDIIIEENVIAQNAAQGVLARTITDRKSGGVLVQTSRMRIENNLLVKNGGTIGLPWPYERSSKCTSQGNLFSSSGDFLLFGHWGAELPAGAADTVTRRLTEAQLQLPTKAVRPQLSLEGWRASMKQDSTGRVLEVSLSIEEHGDEIKVTLDGGIKRRATWRPGAMPWSEPLVGTTSAK